MGNTDIGLDPVLIGFARHPEYGEDTLPARVAASRETVREAGGHGRRDPPLGAPRPLAASALSGRPAPGSSRSSA
ncbi:hypothetical protein IAG44_41505 [Streptomyces roseirectus]|uniref:Uncharacterized protein n=1 Tax=Streptomyces roseirectus TaxID=2768066 RepID=A0A7H0IR34_9ACTN|nr:hypothetical protein [Streptomyces roseirectus]QNP75250.1 hypothetical protein IAG44_41505 [Streptomyces roseirectus]